MAYQKRLAQPEMMRKERRREARDEVARDVGQEDDTNLVVRDFVVRLHRIEAVDAAQNGVSHFSQDLE